MKRTISLIIAVAVMVAMFIVPVSAEEFIDPNQISSEGDWELGGDTGGTITITSGKYVIDLCGYTLTGQIIVEGGDLTIKDTSAEKTGTVNAVEMGDAIDIRGGKVTLDGITVIGAHTSGDAVFVSGSPEITIKNCVLTAGKVGIDNTSATAKVVVENTTFADFETLAPGQPKDARNGAFEFRSNAKITLNAGNTFNVTTVVCRSSTHSISFAESIVAGAGVEVSFEAEDTDLGTHGEAQEPYLSNVISYSSEGTTTPDNGGSTTPDNGGSTTPDNGGSTTPDNNNNADTGDFMSLVIVVAAAALVVTVLSKKRAF